MALHEAYHTRIVAYPYSYELCMRTTQVSSPYDLSASMRGLERNLPAKLVPSCSSVLLYLSYLINYCVLIDYYLNDTSTTHGLPPLVDLISATCVLRPTALLLAIHHS